VFAELVVSSGLAIAALLGIARAWVAVSVVIAWQGWLASVARRDALDVKRSA